MTGTTQGRPTRTLGRRWLPPALTTLFLAVVLGTTLAQSSVPLERLAPADAIVALGLTPGDLPEGDLMDAFEALDTDAAQAALERLGEVFDEVDGMPSGMRGGMGGIGFFLDDALDAAGDVNPGELGGAITSELEQRCPGLESEATAFLETSWADDLLLSVAWDRFSSIPGGLALARISEEALPDANALHARLIDCFAAEPLGSAEGVTLDLLGDGSDLPLVVATTGDLFIVGTQPELVRGALARHAGSDTSSLADRPAAFLDRAVGARVYYDLASIADIVESLVPVPTNEPALAAAVERGLAVLRTVGNGASRLALTADGVTSTARTFPDPDGGDAALYDLLTCAGCEAPDASWAVGGAVSVQGASFDLGGWIDWLDGLVANVSEATMGAPTTFRGALRDELGIDLDLLLVDWIGDQLVTSQLGTISTDLRDLIATPTVTIVAVRSNAAAEAGLDAIEAALADLRSELEDAEGDRADLADFIDQIAIRRGETMGVPFRRVQGSAVSDLRIAVVDDLLVIATREDAFESAIGLLNGSIADGTSSAGWQAVEAASSGSVSSWRYADGGAPLEGLVDLLELAAQPAAAALAAASRAALDQPDDAGFADEAVPTEDVEAVDLASAFGYPGPDGVTTAVAPELAFGSPVESAIDEGTPTYDFDAIEIWSLPSVPAGTEVSVVMTSSPLDTYLYLYDATTGEVLAENDDAPWTDRSEIVFVSDGRDLLVGATSWSGSGEGDYRIEVTTAAPVAAEPEPEPEPVEAEPDVEAPTFAELLSLTEIVPDAVAIIAERLELSWTVTSSDDGAVSTRSLQTFTW